MDYKDLVKEAFVALENAYAPYSNFKVGACVLCKDGTKFYGANVENASYGATVCGERNAIFAAYSNGYRKEDIEAIGIVTDHTPNVGYPCGICRQVFCELLEDDTPIVLSNGKDIIVTNIVEILPNSFSSKDLE